MNTTWRLILYSFFLIAPPVLAQSTTVTATVVDQSSVTWANGSYILQFVPNPQAQGNPTWNGTPFPNTQWTYAGVLDASGHFSKSVPSNNFIAPAGSTYTGTFCSNTSAPCVVIPRLTFQGTTMDISATITNAAVPFNIQAQSIPRAYNDAEMAVQASQAGYFYQNVTQNSPRYWNGASWSNFGGTLTSVGITSFDPLFTTTASGPPNAPLFTFNPELAIGNAVYGTCGSVSAIFPSFCNITAAMLPSSITSNTSGNAASSSQLDHTPTGCTGNNFSKGINALGNATCTQPTFGNLLNNISISQMNSGTGASTSTFWRGDGTWVAPPQPTVPNIQSASTSGCTTGASTFSTCTSIVTWPVAFADTGYQSVCFGNSPNDPRAALQGTSAKTASSITVITVTNGSNAVSYGNIDCIALHP